MSGTSVEPAPIRRWERLVDWPLMAAAFLFLAAYAVPILSSSAPSTLLDVCRWLSWATWVVFVAEFAVRLSLARPGLPYLVQHWYDVLVIALPCSVPSGCSAWSHSCHS